MLKELFDPKLDNWIIFNFVFHNPSWDLAI